MNKHLQSLVIESNPIKFHPDWIRPQMVTDCNGVSSAIAHALNVEMVTGLHDSTTPADFLTHVFKKVDAIATALRYLFFKETEGENAIPCGYMTVIYKGKHSTSIDVELDDKGVTSAISIRLTGVDFLHN